MVEDPATTPIAGHIEVLEQASSAILVQGWFRMDPALRARMVPSLHIGPPDAPAQVWPLRRLHDRADLPARDGLAPGYGFQVVIPVAVPWQMASAQLVVGDRLVALTPILLHPRPAHPRGALERPSRWGVSGWIVDLMGRQPVLLVDGRYAVKLSLDKVRPDLPFDDGQEAPMFGFHISLSALGDALRCADPAATLLDWKTHSVALLVGGIEVGHQPLTMPRRMGGMLENTTPDEAFGWGTEVEGGDQEPTVDLVLDGTRWHSAKAITPRADLAANGVGKSLRGGAFRIGLPRRNPTEAQAPELKLHPSHAQEPLAGTTILEGLPPWTEPRGHLIDTLPQLGPPPNAVIVPICDTAGDLERCIESVIQHSTGIVRLILIDDACSDPAVAEVLARWANHAGVALHRNATPLGFTATVNRGIALAERDDVVLLNSGTVVGPSWLDGLRYAAWSSPRVGTVTPLSNNAGVFSVPEHNTENFLPEWFAPSDMARLVRQVSLSILPPVPIGHGSCLYIRRDCLHMVGTFDESAFPHGGDAVNDFCMRAQRHGFETLVDDRTWVWHRRSDGSGEARDGDPHAGQALLTQRYPEYRTLTSVLREDTDLLAIRWRIRRALEATIAHGKTPRPRLLFVISTQSGGTPQTNHDLMAALVDCYEPWVLRSDSRMVELMRHGALLPAETHQLKRPILPSQHQAADYDRIVADLLVRHGFELVHVRHIAWHGLGLTAVCRRLGIPIVFSFHDFYTVCPTVKLLDAERRFCGGSCTEGDSDCTPELWPAAEMPPLRDRFVHRWRAMMAEALASCDAFVTTSPFARSTLLDAFPSLAGRDFRLIQHGRSFARMENLTAEPTLDGPLRVLVPGNISVAKGAALVAEMAALDTEREVEFHVLGNVDATLQQGRPGVVLHGPYDREAFAVHLQGIQPHLAAVLSIWPETYCHTLTECWAAGVPVLAAALGAQAERIGIEGGGWLFEPSTTAAELLHWLLTLKRDLPALRARRHEVLDWQHRIGRHYDTAGMAASYDVLYRDVLTRRRSFASGLAASLPVVLAVMRREESNFRFSLPGSNSVARGAVFRAVSPAYPFGDAAAGPGDLVLLGAGAARLRDMPEILACCAVAALPLVIEADAMMAAVLLEGGTKADTLRRLFMAAEAVLATSPRAALELAAAGIEAVQLPELLDAAAWLVPISIAPPMQEDRPCRLLAFAEDAALIALRPALASLEALHVIELVLVSAVPAGEDPVRAFRLQSEGCDLALLPEPTDLQTLACAAAGLVVLRGAATGETPGETAEGTIVLPNHPLVRVQLIGELSVEPERRALLARRARRHALTRMVRGGQASALDALLAGVVRFASKKPTIG